MMKLSNFDWTDKDSLRWFILLPTGHEGPYSLKNLIHLKNKKQISQDFKIWAEGLADPVIMSVAVLNSELMEKTPNLPLTETDEIPPIPFEASNWENDPVEEVVLKKSSPSLVLFKPVLLTIVAVTLVIMGIRFYIKSSESFHLTRLPKMSLDIYQRILRENTFDGWSKDIFFKEYMPQDHSHLWLVTSSYQSCKIEAKFNSVKDGLLSLKQDKVSFSSSGFLFGHVAELSAFDYKTGNRIIPGLYEMDIKATDCDWDGFVPEIMNWFSVPRKDYIARVRVVLFSNGPEDFYKNLDSVLNKKNEFKRKEKELYAHFWQDLQQKFQTLEAISLQIEQHFLDFLDNDPSSFEKKLKPMVTLYAKSFGSFLTSFVIENENYFKKLDSSRSYSKRNYELLVKLTSKNVGYESMKFIEEFQKLKKNPSKKELVKMSTKVKSTFAGLKKDIGQKLIRVSLDQGNP